MSQIQKGFTYTSGSPNNLVTYTNLNQLADSAILLPGAITDQTSKATPDKIDSVLIYSASDSALRKTTVSSLISLTPSYVFNVKTYGAVGDGTADDTAAFNSAINAAIAVNGTVVIPAGDYIVSSDLAYTFQGRLTIRGEGMNTSRIIYTGLGYALDFEMSIGSYPELSSVNLHDFSVLHDHPTGAANSGITIRYPLGSIFSETHQGCRLDNLYIGAKLNGTYSQSHVNAGFGYGLKLFNVGQANVSNIYIYGNFTTCNITTTPGDGAGGAGSGKGLWVRNCVNNIYENINVRFFSQGIYLDVTTGNNNQGNLFNHVNILTCPEAFRTDGLVDSWTLDNFQIDNGNDFSTINKLNIRGIVINSNFTSGYGGRISNGTCEVGTTFGGPALLLNATAGIQVSNCRFFTSNTSAAVPYGIKLTGNTTDCQFSDIYAQGAGSNYGMYVDAGCARNIIKNLTTYGSGGYYDSSANLTNNCDYYLGKGAFVNMMGGPFTVHPNTETAIVWNNVKFDDLGVWNSSNGAFFTVPYDCGIKRISISSNSNWLTNGSSFNRQIKIKNILDENFAGSSIPASNNFPTNYASCGAALVDLTLIAGNWSNSSSYSVGTTVRSPANGRYYICTSAVSSTTDPSLDPSHWNMLYMQFKVTAIQDSGIDVTLVTSSNFIIKFEG
jgi:hypothetical protein